ncbi:MAG: hypothetical protein ABII93_00865 [Chrysiogenia bacterium]
MEKGSMLVLAIIATLILSLIMMAGLTVSTTEVHTTHNYFLNKVSYYKAVEGIERVIDQIRSEPDPSSIFIVPNDYKIKQDGMQKLFITGTLIDIQNNTTQNVRQFDGFAPPPLPSISLGPNAGISPIIWYVPITSEVTVNKKRSYTEIEAGIYSSVTIAY